MGYSWKDGSPRMLDMVFTPEQDSTIGWEAYSLYG
jgi:hypothetical protein